MTTERRALLVTPMFPSTGGNGLAIRIAMFAEALGRVAETDILCIPVFGSAGDPGWARRLGFAVHCIDPIGRDETAYRLSLMLTDPAQRLAAFRRYARPSFEAKLSLPVLEDVRRCVGARRYDVVHVERGYLMPVASAVSARRLTADLDEDDAWSLRSVGRLRDPAGAAWSRAEAEAADRSLAAWSPSYDSLYISGPVDCRRLARRHKAIRPHVVPNPAPAAAAGTRHDDGETVLFVGSFGYLPNLDGMYWFIEVIWPLVRRHRPTARLRIVGRDMPDRLKLLDGRDHIDVLGAVADLAAVYATATVAIAPLRAGGGTRIKLIEAAAYGVPVIATTLAARGLAFATAEGMWLADSPERFADAVLAALGDHAERARRAANSAQSVIRNHDRDSIIDQLTCRFAALLDKEGADE